MKVFTTLILLIILSNLYSQDLLEVNLGTDALGFENPSDSGYVLLDSNDVWAIGNPEKEILFLPGDGNAIFTDTNKYYQKNLDASVQFRLFYESGFNVHALSFNHKYDFETGKDGGKIETSYNNGQSWQNLLLDEDIQNEYFYSFGLYSFSDSVVSFTNEPGFTGQQSNFEICYVEWSFDHVNDTVLIRFNIASDSVDKNNEGWLIDDVHFYAILVGLEDIKYSDLYHIFPNPVTDFLTVINKSENAVTEIKIYTIYGQLKICAIGGERFTVKVSDLNPGIYIVNINDSYVTKFLKL